MGSPQEEGKIKMSVSMMMDKREVEGSCGFMDALSTCDPEEAFFDEEKACPCSSSSSIGENSDTISQGSMDDSQEVESPFTSIQALPIRKGMSRFYNGKSKSFTSLREASTSCSVKELAKPENGSYIINKKRRNILACHLANNKRAGISKRTTLHAAAAAAMDSGPSQNSSNHSNSNFSDWRSFSLADLQFEEAQKESTN